MAKEKEEAKVVKGERELRWEAHLDAYKKRNPIKFAEKEARGQFKHIPADFE